MDLVEKARIRLEEKQELQKDYNEKINLLQELENQHKEKVEKKSIALMENSGIVTKQQEIERLRSEIEKEEKLVNQLTRMFSKKLSKSMGIDKLVKTTEEMYNKIYTPDIAMSFKLKDLIKEMYKISGKKYKVEFLFVKSTNDIAYFVLRVKKCYLNVRTNLKTLDTEFIDLFNAFEIFNLKNSTNAIFEIEDATLLNFFEQETNDKTQQVVKEALKSLSSKQELSRKTDKNID